MICVLIKVWPHCPMRWVLSHLAEEGSEQLSQALKFPYRVNGKTGLEPRSSHSRTVSYCPAPTTFPHEGKEKTHLEKGILHRLHAPPPQEWVLKT